MSMSGSAKRAAGVSYAFSMPNSAAKSLTFCGMRPAAAQKPRPSRCSACAISCAILPQSIVAQRQVLFFSITYTPSSEHFQQACNPQSERCADDVSKDRQEYADGDQSAGIQARENRR